MFKKLFFIVFFLFSNNAWPEITRLEELPVQEGGRIKPFDTVAREALQLIYGRSKFQGEKATKIVSTWIMVPDVWEEKEFLRIDHKALKQALNLNPDQKYFKYKDVYTHNRISVLIRELQGKEQAKERLNSFDHAVRRLEGQLITFKSFRHGALQIVPPVDASETTWQPLSQLAEPMKESFFSLLKNYAVTFSSKTSTQIDEENYQKSLVSFVESAKSVNPSKFPSDRNLKIEVMYNELQPFMWSWIFYALSFILVLLGVFLKNKILNLLGWGVLSLAFLTHTFGFFMRVYLAGRPPVSNMYETVIWVGWGVTLFALIIFMQKRRYDLILGGTFISFLCMVVADNSPIILNPSIQPLEAVLRSNMWLIIHVMPISLSYAAFFLALAMANIGLINILQGHSDRGGKINEIVDSCYRSIQFGVVLLAAGTILGGVWADYSWGRFWGWDPKEVWAFVTLMGYLGLLHARLAGWIRQFGMIVGSIVSFSLVIMAWYGVNFVLGEGLHSYGFGAGGIEYVSAFVGLQFIFVIYVFVVKRMQDKNA